MKRFFKISLRPFFFILLLTILASCNPEAALEKKGRGIMERMLSCNPRISSIVEVRTTEPYEGLTLIESSLLMADSAANHLYIAEVDLEKGLAVRTSTPGDKPYGPTNFWQTLPKQAQAAEDHGQKVLLGVNADVFGRYWGLNYFTPRGAVYVDGEDRSAGRGGENLFYVLKDGSAHLDSYEAFEKVESEVLQAVGVWQFLVKDGEGFTADAYPERNLTVVNPRTFIGVSEDGKTVWLVAVDGRQPGYSKGFLMEDMVSVCQAVGCYRACNLDGGGSTTMVIRQENEDGADFVLLNTPSDLRNGKRTPRMVVNGLLVVEK